MIQQLRMMKLLSEDEEAKSYNETNFNETKATCKIQNILCFTHIFINYYSIIVAVSVYCYLINIEGNSYYHLTKQIMS